MQRPRSQPFRRRHLVLVLAFAVVQLLAACSADLTGWIAKSTGGDAGPVRVPAVIPLPAHYEYGEGRFVIGPDTRIAIDPGDAKNDPDKIRIARYLAELVMRTGGSNIQVVPMDAVDGPAHAIVLHRLSDPDATGKEGYRLDVSPEGVTISASETAGLLYGAITFSELASEYPGSTATLPSIHIDDTPRFAWRGILLDSARHFQSPEFVKSFIDAMALHKLNVLQWHLTDDQGWRLEIKKYPKLTSVGAWRVPAGDAAQHDIDSATHKPRLYGGFYTQAEVKDIVRYAADRNITIVPEIEMPGHAEAAIVAYPQLGSVPNPPKTVSSDWGVFPYLYNVDDSTFAFLENVLTETMALFPSHYIHVGGDEAVKDQWKASPKIQAQMKALGIAKEDALQGYFTARIGKFLADHGRRLIGWDEILEGGVPPDATITSWRGVDGGIAAAKSGHDAVMSPAPVLYFDNRQGYGPDEPSGRGHVTSLEDVYRFEPAPATLPEDARAHIIGVQGNIWTEHIREEHQVDYMAFPRAAALAEIAWSPAASHDWHGFLTRLALQMDRYRDLGIPAALSAFAPQMTTVLHKDRKSVDVMLTDQTGFGVVRHNMSVRDPLTPSSSAANPFTVNLPSVIGAATFADGHQIGFATALRLLASSLLERKSQELKLCTDHLSLNLRGEGPHKFSDPVYLVDVMNPCWIYPKVEMESIVGIDAEVGRLPFNFQLGDDASKIPMKTPETPDGELEVHLDSCDGPRIADMPLARAAANDETTGLSARIAPVSGAHDLCFIFTRSKLDPMWVIDFVRLWPQTE